MKKVSKSSIVKLFPKRSKKTNKTDAGRVLIIGGGKGLLGAGLLAAQAATRSGAGYTYLFSDIAKFPWQKFPDFIVQSPSLKELKTKKDFSIAIGPGLGSSPTSKSLFLYLLKHQFENVTVDADALTLIAKLKKNRLPSSWVLTPHEGELARLLGISSKEVQANRKKYLICAQEKFGCHILLKGAQTLIINPEKEIYYIDNSTPALAKAGTGDVLVGIITAMRAQKLSPIEAMKVACYVHGWASKQWLVSGHNVNSLRPVDLIELISIFPKSRT